MKKLMLVCGALVILIFGSSSVSADEISESIWGWGPRVGLSLDPDQVVVGGHVDFGRIAKHVRFQPNAELGIGDDLTIFALNFDANYRFNEKWDSWSPYLGGGIGVSFVSYDNEGLGDGSDSDFGASLLGGIERGLKSGNRFFLEAKLGLVDSPDLKLMVGWTFAV